MYNNISVVKWNLLCPLTIKMAYMTARQTIRKQFSFLKSLVLWISTALLSWGIGIGIFFSLSLVSFAISGSSIAWTDTIEQIIAFAFIVGFYNEDALAMLGRIRGQLILDGDDDQDEQTQQTQTKEETK